MATITIKFKDTLTISSDFNINIEFTSNGNTYTAIESSLLMTTRELSYINNSGQNSVYDPITNSWDNIAYQIITLDTNQTNFNEFITAMKDNIEGVLLESGTYVWNNSITSPINNVSTSINFVSNSKNFTSIGIIIVSNGRYLFYSINSDNSYVYNFKSDTWVSAVWQTIFVETDQYIDYDFYNYAILGNQLVKQQAEVTYTCKWYLDGTLVNTSTFSHEQITGVDYNVIGSTFKVMFSAETLATYDYGVNLNSETSNASLGSDNIITIEAFKGNITFNITSNGTTTLATKNTYVPSDIDFVVNVPSVQLQEKSEYITSNTQTIITPDTGKALSKVTITTDVPQMIEVATSAEMDAKLTEDNVSLYFKYTGTTDDKYTNGDIYQVQDGE